MLKIDDEGVYTLINDLHYVVVRQDKKQITQQLYQTLCRVWCNMLKVDESVIPRNGNIDNHHEDSIVEELIYESYKSMRSKQPESHLLLSKDEFQSSGYFCSFELTMLLLYEFGTFFGDYAVMQQVGFLMVCSLQEQHGDGIMPLLRAAYTVHDDNVSHIYRNDTVIPKRLHPTIITYHQFVIGVLTGYTEYLFNLTTCPTFKIMSKFWTKASHHLLSAQWRYAYIIVLVSDR